VALEYFAPRPDDELEFVAAVRLHLT